METYLDIQGLSSYLVPKRSKGAIRNMVLRRQIPFRKVAGRLVFLQREIDEWIKSSSGLSFEDLRRG